MSMINHTEIMCIAALRDELVTDRQLRKHGLSRDTVAHLVQARVLTPVFRQVYSVTPGPIDDTRRSLALCLAVPHGVLSHQTAAAHWQLRRAPRGMLDLTVRAPRQVRLPDVRIHRITELDLEDVVTYANGLRVTTPARTLFDLATLVSPPVLASAAQDALNRRLCTPWSLGDVGERMIRQGRPGSTAFRELIDGRAATLPAVGSDGELVLAEALEAQGLPPLTRQFEVALDTGAEVRLDLAVPPDRFAVEVDDPSWHASPVALQRDHARDLLLRAEDWEVLRVTSDDVFHRLRSTSARIAVIYFRRRSAHSLCA
jgi:very-short-patch-repair endonuclease